MVWQNDLQIALHHMVICGRNVFPLCKGEPEKSKKKEGERKWQMQSKGDL